MTTIGRDAHEAYLMCRVLSADPVELVRMLYRGARDAVREARTSLANGQTEARCGAISKALAILAELETSLDHGAGGELSRRLAALYEYMQHRLLEANIEKASAPLAEVGALLSTLLEGWEGVPDSQTPPTPVPVMGVPEMAAAQNWVA